ncbi:uncharacterized protein AB675_11723 [Cyphellophora attinorum]|uniref:DUF7918 domain-containing protein n=1 Tax=Cyphellophora attinorum TaxID=1664694 RepID=A0A0N1GY15_9EURO|nr:uncharacterized protein AB675_11723 [Phialophora attinorum]KPI35384.1 hypothetical protein AB675_11723 [Phialophora attinorum]
MPCFKGLAVSIHTPNGPLPEYSVQKQSRLSRISTYIPVPPPKVPTDASSTKPEPSSFAISITLLTPGQDVPYSTPKSSITDPNPKPRVVGGLPGHGDERGKYIGGIGPYVPLTTSPNETIAAYIYFDGRAKEEVATLLRKGEETWVNSRWVSVPDSEGGGLAEREFLFREVGLERWLNGLDLEGKDAAATIEKRKQKLERRRRKRKEKATSDDEANGVKTERRKSTLRYGADGQLENISDDSMSDGSDSSDDEELQMPEASGQIKVALFRVLASGEIKRGEYSPQFGAHDDDEDSDNKESNGDSKADVDHTTSFAKPKTLDPKTISTQTVTGIDPTDKPYAVFTFLYRGERQLQKMGILSGPKGDKATPASKRKSLIGEIPKLGPLKKEGTAGFSQFRDRDGRKSKRDDPDEMESDEDNEEGNIIGKMDDINDADVKNPSMLSPEDAERTGAVAEASGKSSNGANEARKSSKSGSTSNSPSSTPNLGLDALGTSPAQGQLADVKKEDEFMVGSPLKKQRSSMADFDDDFKRRLQRGLAAQAIGDVLGSGSKDSGVSGLQFGASLGKKPADNDDDEL